jgi:hypothetical protein
MLKAAFYGGILKGGRAITPVSRKVSEKEDL